MVPRIYSFFRDFSTNAILFDGILAFRPMKCCLVKSEALADFLRRGSASASGSKSQAVATLNLQRVVLCGGDQGEVTIFAHICKTSRNSTCRLIR